MRRTGTDTGTTEAGSGARAPGAATGTDAAAGAGTPARPRRAALVAALAAVVAVAVAVGLCWTFLVGRGAGGEPDRGEDPVPGTSTGSTPGAKAGGDDGEPAVRGGTDPTPTASGFDFDPDPDRVPRDRAGALALAREVAARPEEHGRDYRKATPYESGPRDWNVLDDSCAWRRGEAPESVLASFTRRAVLPAADGRGAVRVSATVTVHRAESPAEWEMAETLEEALRCPDQRLGATERITGLMSLGSGYGEGANLTADDTLMEAGKFLDERTGGDPAYYAWHQDRLGPVTVALVVKGAKGHSDKELRRTAAETMTFMKTRLRKALEGDA